MAKTRAFVVLALLACSWPGESQASPVFPGEIQSQLGLECAPQCTICHRTSDGGTNTIDKVFAGSMILNGLQPKKEETVGPALQLLIDNAIDSDEDGVGDVQELIDGRNPSVAPAEGVSDALFCGPQYGCGARISGERPVDGSALAVALAFAAGLWLRRRR